MSIFLHTFRVWGLLTRTLPANPLYNHFRHSKSGQMNLFQAFGLRNALLLIGLTVLAGAFMSNVVSNALLMTAAVIGLLGALALLMFTGTGSGILWTLNISGTLHKTRQTGLGDLLAISPIESYPWIIATGILHRSPVFQTIFDQTQTINIQFRRRPALIIAAVIALGIVFTPDMIISGTIIGSALFALYIDQVQSCIVAALLSLWITGKNLSENDVRTFALFGFLAVQLAAYLATALIFLWLFPQLGIISGWGYGIPQVAVLYLTREWTIALLWRSVPAYSIAQVPTDENNTPPVARTDTPE